MGRCRFIMRIMSPLVLRFAAIIFPSGSKMGSNISQSGVADMIATPAQRSFSEALNTHAPPPHSSFTLTSSSGFRFVSWRMRTSTLFCLARSKIAALFNLSDLIPQQFRDPSRKLNPAPVPVFLGVFLRVLEFFHLRKAVISRCFGLALEIPLDQIICIFCIWGRCV